MNFKCDGRCSRDNGEVSACLGVTCATSALPRLAWRLSPSLVDTQHFRRLMIVGIRPGSFDGVFGVLINCGSDDRCLGGYAYSQGYEKMVLDKIENALSPGQSSNGLLRRVYAGAWKASFDIVGVQVLVLHIAVKLNTRRKPVDESPEMMER